MAEVIEFMKMEGTGNDFIVIDNRNLCITNQKLASLAPHLCDRKFGIGADGIIALDKSEKEGSDYRMNYRNADGSDAGMCGNGARCIALFAYHQGFGNEQVFTVHDYSYKAKIHDGNKITISFPVESTVTEIEDDDGSLLFKINTGTEHIVRYLELEDLNDEERLKKNGSRLRYHRRFKPEGTNVNFICELKNNSLKLKTYERGVEDLTLSCGTGAIASAISIHHKSKNENSGSQTYSIHADGGILEVSFDYNETTGNYSNFKLTGPAHFVFKGKIEI